MSNADPSILVEFLTEASSLLAQITQHVRSLRAGADAGTEPVDLCDALRKLRGAAEFFDLAGVAGVAGEMAKECGRLGGQGGDEEARIIDRLKQLCDELADCLKALQEQSDASETPIQAPSAGDNPDLNEFDRLFSEEEDKELLSIFLAQQYNEYAELKRVLDSTDPTRVDVVGQDLKRVHGGLDRLQRAANYMGYDDLVTFYNGWMAQFATALEQTRQGAVPELSFLLEWQAAWPLAELAPETLERFKTVAEDTQRGPGRRERSGLGADVGEKTQTEIGEPEATAMDLSLLDDFVVEANEHLEAMESRLLALAADASQTHLYNDLFTDIHTIKGASQYTGLARFSALSHALEDLLDGLRRDGRAVKPNELECFIQGRDRLATLLNELATRQKEESGVADLLNQIVNLANSDSTAPLADQMSVDVAVADERATDAVEAPIEGEASDQELFTIFLNQQRAGVASVLAELDAWRDSAESVRALRRATEHLDRLYRAANYMDYTPLSQCYAKWRDEVGDAVERLASGEPVQLQPAEELLRCVTAILPALHVDLAAKPALKLIANGAKSVDQPAQTKGTLSRDERTALAGEQKSGTRSFKKSVRVDAEKIDFLMNQIGELVVQRTFFTHLQDEMRGILRYFKDDIGLDKAALRRLKSFAGQFGEGISALAETAGELQDGVMKMRMLPISQLFNRYPRLVHDLTRSSGKQVRLQINGEETELDRMIVEELSDPLIHIIRNAIDHGVETLEERRRAGKSEIATLTIEAAQESNQIVIQVSDDGRGIDLDRVRAKALSLNLRSSAELDRMSEKEVLWLVTQPGFSTSDNVSLTSGRGVGMDVVKRNIEKLNGTIEIRSKFGVFTQVRLKIPLTLAIIPALQVSVAGHYFSIPLANVDQMLRLDAFEPTWLEGLEVVHLRGKTLPLLRLGDLYHLAHSRPLDERAGFIVVVKGGHQRIGLVVDALLGEDEVVIKPLVDYLQDGSSFSGATIVGEGHISLILDIRDLVSIVTRSQMKRHQQQHQPEVTDHD